MASVPCAAYQANQFHNRLRMQETQRSSPNDSQRGTDNSASPANTASLRGTVDQITEWVGNSIKTFKKPLWSSQQSSTDSFYTDLMARMPDSPQSSDSVSNS